MADYEENDYWASVVIPYKPYYAFEETLAAFGDAPRSPLSLLGAYERLAAAITEGQVRALGAMSEETRLMYRAAFIRPRQPPPGDIYLSYVPEDRMWADWIAAVLAPARHPRTAAAFAAAAGGNAGRMPSAERRRPAARSPSCLLPTCSRRRPRGVWDAMVAADPAGTSRRLIPVQVGETRSGAAVLGPAGRWT